MTRTEAERIAADRNRGTRAGVTYYARSYYMEDGRYTAWAVVQNDHGYERIVEC